MPGRDGVPEEAVAHQHDWGAPVKVARLGGHYNHAVQACSGCPALRVDNGIVANVYEHAEEIRNQERQRIQEALKRPLMMAEELDAAADTWQDRDSLSEHCRRLAKRAREIHNALAALDTLDPSNQEVRSDDADQAAARRSSDAPAVDGSPRPGQPGTDGGSGAGADPSPARSRTRSAELALDPSGEQGEEARYTTEQVRMRLREAFTVSEWLQSGEELEYFLRRLFPPATDPSKEEER